MRRLVFVLALLSAATARADDVVRVGMADLAVQTHKWDGKTIETTAYCFYTDVNEFRCIYPHGARVDFVELEPDDLRGRIEKNCDTVGKAFTRACLVKFRFVYDHFDTLTGDDGSVIHVVAAKDDEGTLLAK